MFATSTDNPIDTIGSMKLSKFTKKKNKLTSTFIIAEDSC